MANIRTFVAILISEEARNAISEMIRELQDMDNRLRWVKPDNIHLTLKFLGGVQEEKLPDLKQALEFSLIDTIGTFEDAIAIAGKFGGIKGKPKKVEFKKKRKSVFDLLYNEIQQNFGSRIGVEPAYRWQ